MSKERNTGCVLAGMLDIKGKDQWRRVYSIHGIAATLVTCGGGQQHMKIFDEKKLRVRKLTPKEYGILQAFPMDDWKQVVSDSQAYKQFGNAVTTTVFTAIAQEIKKSILQSESEEISMKESKEFKGMNAPEEPPKDETGQEKENTAAVTGEEKAKAAAVGEEPGNIPVDELAEKIVANLFEKTILPGIVFDMAVASTIEYITHNLDGLYALNEEMAANEAAYAVAQAKKYWSKCPVAYDLEYDTVSYARKNGVSIGKAQATAFAVAFLKEVITAGYIPVLYTNKDYAQNYFDIPAIEKALGQRIYIWYARYTSSISADEKAACHIWQKSSTGKVDGISGNVDINEFYTDFETVISTAAEEKKTVCNINILEFQKAANLDGYTDQDGEKLKEDGVDGPKTQFVRKKVNLKAVKGENGFRTYSKGSLVKYWQTRLAEMGYNTDIDGSYGPNTREKTIAMQKDYGLSADGVAGYNTLSTSFYN